MITADLIVFLFTAYIGYVIHNASKDSIICFKVTELDLSTGEGGQGLRQ